MPTPLPLPENYNPATYMLSKTTEYGLFHETRQAARLAMNLVANGTPKDLALAEKVLNALLVCQERDPSDPHMGNFYWMREDSYVEDLNAVEFNLESLIPMMLHHGDRLPAELRQRVLASIRLGLDEIRCLDVLILYTNITTLDILNTCLGAELLADQPLLERGRGKLAAWIAYTNVHGHPLEYNSPTYTSVTLRALKQLVDTANDEEVRRLANEMMSKLALSVLLHIHRGTGRWAGPHGRAYQPSVVCETPPEIEMVRSWIANGTIPAELTKWLDERPDRFQVVETAERDRQLAITTYHTSSYALGTATRALNPQANLCMLHYRRPAADRPGVLYTRYLLDDKWFGDAYHATDRTKTRNLPDEGDFYSVQDENRMIGIYGPQNFRQGRSAKAVLIWTQIEQIDQVWVDGQPVNQFPYGMTPGQLLIVASGEALIAVRPLTVTPLGRTTPIQLVERNGDLVLEMFNYRGPEKRFWEMGWPGAFYKGKPIVAFYLEVAERSEYADAASFAAAINAGSIEQQMNDPYTWAGVGERIYRAAYQRNGQEIGIEIDLMAWQLKKRWTERGEMGWPTLEFTKHT